MEWWSFIRAMWVISFMLLRKGILTFIFEREGISRVSGTRWGMLGRGEVLANWL